MNLVSHPFALPRAVLLQQLRAFLALDVGFGDLSSGMIPATTTGHATIITKSSGILAGAEEAALLFEDNGIEVEQTLYDGATITSGMNMVPRFTCQSGTGSTLMPPLHIAFTISRTHSPSTSLLQVGKHWKLPSALPRQRSG